MRNSINWIGIDDHADKLTIALYVGEQKRAAKEWEVAPTDAGLRQLVRWLKSLDGPVRCIYEAWAYPDFVDGLILGQATTA